MLWYAEFTWFPGVRREDVARRIVEQDDAGTIHPDKIKAWYGLAGGGAGFLIIENEDPRQVTEMLQPFMDLMSFDVRAIYEFPYHETLERMRQVVRQSG